MRRHGDAPLRQRVEQLRLRLEWKLNAVGRGDRIAKESEGSRRGDGGIELPEASGGGVAWSGEDGIAGAGPGFVHLLEAIEREVDLAANLDASLRRALVQAQRNVAHRPEIHRHVLADGAITTCGALDEKLVFVRERDSDAIDLELSGVPRFRDVVAGDPHQSLFPGAQLLVVEGVVEREHLPKMLVLGELALRLGTDTQSRRIRSEAFRKSPLQLLQLSKELVVLCVRHRRTVENVVLVGCAGEESPQLPRAAKPGLVGLLPGPWVLRTRQGRSHFLRFRLLA